MSANFESGPLASLKPETFWKHFYALTQIPHPSKHEEKIGEYIIDFAKKHNLEWKKDAVGNVLVSKPATAGYENSPGVILQSHMDMVCEKNNDVEFDFFTQPLKIILDGDFVRADGTSLGADNGVGVAASLAVLEDGSMPHPPIEALFTMDEETGMTGAKGLTSDFLKGRRLLNLDSEDESDIYIGCSGGIDNKLVFKPEFEKPGCGNALKVTVKGLKGGHSGLEIDKERANALKLLGRFLWNIKAEGLHWGLASFAGGNKRNAIPREAEAVLYCGDQSKLIDASKRWEKIYSDEFRNIEDGVIIAIEKASGSFERVLTEKSAAKLLDAVFILHHGIVRMDRSIKGLVESSTNLAIIETKGNEITFDISHRSSSATVKEAISQRTQAFAELLGFEYSKGEGYPGWLPNLESPMLKKALQVHKEAFGNDFNVKAIHAGLECGLILEKYPDMDAVSIGPNLAGVHSPDEVVSVKSVGVFYKFLTEYLKGLK